MIHFKIKICINSILLPIQKDLKYYVRYSYVVSLRLSTEKGLCTIYDVN